LTVIQKNKKVTFLRQSKYKKQHHMFITTARTQASKFHSVIHIIIIMTAVAVSYSNSHI